MDLIAKRRMAPRMVVLALIMLACPLPALAYIDPNSGGLLFQLLAPVFAGVVGAWLFLRRAISAFLKGIWWKLTGKSPR